MLRLTKVWEDNWICAYLLVKCFYHKNFAFLRPFDWWFVYFVFWAEFLVFFFMGHLQVFSQTALVQIVLAFWAAELAFIRFPFPKRILNLTWGWVLSQLVPEWIVGISVLFQIGPTSKSLPAFFTFIWFLSGMDPFMPDQVGHLGECRTASGMVAFERLISYHGPFRASARTRIE